MSRKLPSLTSLKAFEAAARTSSFKRAAEELHVTPAAISRQIKELENKLGFLLFDRGNRKVTLTDPGARYAETIRRAFDDISATTIDLMGESTGNDRLVLLVEREFASRWLLPRLHHFDRHEVDVDVEIIPVTDIDEFPAHNAHAAVVYGELSQPGLRQECLLNLHAFPVCAPGLLSGPDKLETPSDLARFRLLHEASTEWWKRWLTVAGVTSVDWTGGDVFHESSLVLKAALAREGVALGDNLLALGELEKGTLIKPFVQACPSGSYFLTTRENMEPYQPLEIFREWLLENCTAQQLECDKWR